MLPCLEQELNALQRRGAERSLSPEDLSGATFTLSNIGSVGGTYTSPVISIPQVSCPGAGDEKGKESRD